MKKILITGASGEVGAGLIEKLDGLGQQIVAIDIKPLKPSLQSKVYKFIEIDVSDQPQINKLFEKYEFDTVFHLAALLSTSAEKNPHRAHIVNAGGTFNMLDATNNLTEKLSREIIFVFPSTIAVYGMSNFAVKKSNPKVKEDQYLDPITMYGVNKLYCENLGKYYSAHYSLLSDRKRFLDFRCVRFPGLLSAFTLPTGGTSDYAPEMIHAAAKGEGYKCFVRPDTRIGFMAMPDAIESLIQIAQIAKNKLSQKIYNVSGFSTSAQDFENQIRKYYPDAQIEYSVDEKRQRIVDSWPMDTDDNRARKDWAWEPKFDLNKTIEEYLMPNISKAAK